MRGFPGFTFWTRIREKVIWPLTHFIEKEKKEIRIKVIGIKFLETIENIVADPR